MTRTGQLAAFFAVIGAAVAAVHEDHLVSRRQLSKRFIDSNGHYNMSFFHINDVHSHLDQFSSSGTDCSRPERGCFGGYARVKTVLDATRPSHPDSLLLNAGDEFQGTMFFSYYGGWRIADTLNQMGFDGMTLGNHEWDRGDDHLGDFLSNLTFPIISANINSDNEKLNRTIKPFHIYDKFQLAVIGVTTDTTPTTSSPGKGTHFVDPIVAVQDTVNFIKSTTNITRIVALTHIGYEQDIRLAKETTGLSLIMGGHSHSKLGNATDAVGAYPTVAQNKEGDEVFVVTAWRWGEHLGYIDITFDESGKVLEYHGAPIHITNTTARDPGLQKQIDEWRAPFEKFAAEEIGVSLTELDQTTCQTQECLMGDLITDAMLDYRLSSNSTPPPVMALANAGGIRASIDEGAITRGEVLAAFPFQNAVVEVVISGQRLWDTLEGIFSKVNQNNNAAVTSFFQISKGTKILYDPSAAVGSKLVSVKFGDVALDRAADYRVVTIDFLATGGDNFFSPAFSGLVTLETLDEVLVNYIKTKSPLDMKLDGRIAVGKKCRKRRTRKN